jgi:DNA-binding response OmpR family regulator
MDIKHIILVDDDPAIQDAFQLILSHAGYKVTVYSNGQPLLTNAFTLPHLFILDKQLSGADGLDICRYLKQQPATSAIPIIILSASPHIRRLATSAGANGFLEKPCSLKDLLASVEQFI